jgi:hypothetical protein
MKFRFFVLALAVMANACGSNEDFLKNQGGYETQADLAVAGTVTLSFKQTYLYRSITIGTDQSSTCEASAKDYETKSGIALIPESLNMAYDEPGRHCARRNAFRQCETYQYVYTFHCRYQIQK